MVPLTLVLIGPVTSSAASGIAASYNWLFEAFPPLAAALIGGVWQVIVIFGVHWGITPVVISNFDTYGRDSFQAFQSIAVIAQMTAAFAVGFKSRNKRFKTTSFSAGVTGIFGITEPALYGVTLRLKKPFICGCIGGAAGAVIASLFGTYYYAYAGLPGLLTIVNAINPDNPMSFIGQVAGVATAITVTTALVYMIGFNDPQDEEETKTEPMNNENMAPTADRLLTLMSPATGHRVELSEVNDESFAQKLLGDGIAIRPSEGIITAPCDAIVSSVIESQHAVGLTCHNGAELLIHVGLDTVNLKGQHFKTLVSLDQVVKSGDPLIQFDKALIEEAGYDLTTPFIILNSDEFSLQMLDENDQVHIGQPMMQIS